LFTPTFWTVSHRDIEPIENRGLHHSPIGQNRAQTRTTVGEGGHLRDVGPAHGVELPLEQRDEVGIGPGDGVKDLATTVNRLDVADSDFQMAFAVVAAVYEGRVQTDRDGRGGDRRMLCCRIGELFTNL
jgi:hypothetical protein